ncbi:MAG: hypothetical protein WB660_15440 [Candidatus Sulfotelmatobacter sp.]
MLKCLSLTACLSAIFAPAAFAGVSVSAPGNGATVSGSVHYVASASSPCSKGVASMGIYTAPGVLKYVVNGSELNTTLSLSPGKYETVVQEWDNCGGASTTPITLTVSGGEGSSGVSVSSPANGSTVGSPVNFKATASTSCSKGVSSIGIYTAPNVLAYVTNGANLNYNLALSPGKYDAVVQEWDGCDGASITPVTITVGSGGGGGGSGSSGGGKSFSNLQRSGGWGQYGQRAPTFVDCSPSPCDNIAFSMSQGVKSPSLTGEATEMYLGGSEPYGDGLWNNHLLGDGTSQGLPDSNHSLVPTLHNFTYDVYFWSGDLGRAQAVEFDLNQFFDNMGFIWGHECRIAGGNEWDVWDNLNQHWVPTGVACNPVSNSWNHLTLQVERTSDNTLLYKSITLNGKTANLNQYYNPGSAPGWYGVTVNYQQDGNNQQSPYSVYLDKLTLSYN